jgi:hypothetical protein
LGFEVSTSLDQRLSEKSSLVGEKWQWHHDQLGKKTLWDTLLNKHHNVNLLNSVCLATRQHHPSFPQTEPNAVGQPAIMPRLVAHRELVKK